MHAIYGAGHGHDRLPRAELTMTGRSLGVARYARPPSEFDVCFPPLTEAGGVRFPSIPGVIVVRFIATSRSRRFSTKLRLVR